jgi:hypothetical protein
MGQFDGHDRSFETRCEKRETSSEKKPSGEDNRFRIFSLLASRFVGFRQLPGNPFVAAAHGVLERVANGVVAGSGIRWC